MKSLYRQSTLTLATFAVGALGLLGLTGVSAHAQGPIEAYKFGLKGMHGSARAQSLGGAVGALGADPTAVYVNPAGIGLYSRGTLSISANPGWGKAKVKWGENHNTISEYKPGAFNNVSYMSPFLENPNSEFKFSLGFAYNQDYDYDRNYKMNTGVLGAGIADMMILIGMDEGRPFGDYLDDNRTGYNPFHHPVHPLVTMGANADLIRPFDDNDKLFRHAFLDTYENGKYHFLPPDRTTLDVAERGSKHSFDMSMGMGFSDVFYVGATLRIGNIKHRRSSGYREDFEFRNKATGEMKQNHLVLSNELQTTGTSFGLNIGALAMLGDYVRLGVSYMTPEFTNMSEIYSSTLYTYNEFMPKDKMGLTYRTANYENNYILRTPGQFTASALVFLGEYGFASYDFQYRNLGEAALYSDNRERNPLTDVIAEDYGKEYTHKFGIEVRPIKRLALRGGMSFTGNPMRGEEFDVEPAGGLARDAVAVGTIPDFILPRSYTTYSLGAGYRFSNSVSLDVAFVNTNRTEQVYPFSGYLNKQEHLGLPRKMEIKGGKMNDIRNHIVTTLTIAF